MKRFIVSSLAITLMILAAYGAVVNWKINASDAKVSFTIKNAGLNVEGKFSGLEGKINFDPENPASGSIIASVSAETIDTGINMRDKDLRTEHYLDVEKYPKISFVSSSISKTSKGFSVTGKFTIKDVTKTVTIPFTFENQTFKGSLTIDRMDYHVGKNSWIMGDEVNIVFEIPVSKAS